MASALPAVADADQFAQRIFNGGGHESTIHGEMQAIENCLAIQRIRLRAVYRDAERSEFGCFLYNDITMIVELPFREPGYLPIVTIRIGKIAAVAAPENVLRGLFDPTSNLFC